MNVKKAILQADELRPNAISEEHKTLWLHQLDGRLAEAMDREAPENLWPEDWELLMPHPYDNLYELYLCSMIDFANLDLDQYATDQAMYDTAYSQALAWWRRHHLPKTTEGGARV